MEDNKLNLHSRQKNKSIHDFIEGASEGIEKKVTKKRKSTLTCLIDNDYLDELERIATKESKSVQSIIRDIIYKFIDGEKS